MPPEHEAITSSPVRERPSGLVDRLVAVPPGRWEWGVAALVGVLAATTVVVVTRGRVAVNPDTVMYVTAADSLGEGGPLGNWLESPLVTFPPAWPVLIAVPTLAGIRTETSAVLLLAAGMAAVPFGALALLRSLTGVAIVRALGVLAVGMSPLVLPWAFSALSELPLVVLLMAVALLAVGSQRSHPGLIWAAVLLASLAPLLRYAAIAVPLALALWIALDRDQPKRLIQGVVAAAAGVIPLALLASWNDSRTGEPFGPRRPSGDGPVEVVVQGLEGIGRTALWGLDAAPSAFEALVGVVVAAVVVGILVFAHRSEDPAVYRSRLLVAVLAGGQWVVLVAARSRTDFDELGPRLLAPTAVLLALLLVAGTGDVVLRDRRGWVRAVALAALVLWCGVGAAAALRSAASGDARLYERAGYVALQGSEAMESVPEGCGAPGSGCVLLANEPWAWYRSGLEPAASPTVASTEADVTAIREAVDSGEDVYLLWTTVQPPKDYLLDLDGLRSQDLRLEEVDSSGELAVYRLR